MLQKSCHYDVVIRRQYQPQLEHDEGDLAGLGPDERPERLPADFACCPTPSSRKPTRRHVDQAAQQR